MNLEFLSGLLLAIVALATVAYLLKQIIADRVFELRKVWRVLSDLLAKHMGNEAKPVNDHLIGVAGSVTAHSRDSARPMKVRVRREFWPARSKSAQEQHLPIGTQIRVTAVDGPVLIVEASPDSDMARAIRSR